MCCVSRLAATSAMACRFISKSVLHKKNVAVHASHSYLNPLHNPIRIQAYPQEPPPLPLRPPPPTFYPALLACFACLITPEPQQHTLQNEILHRLRRPGRCRRYCRCHHRRDQCPTHGPRTSAQVPRPSWYSRCQYDIFPYHRVLTLTCLPCSGSPQSAVG